MDETVMMTEAEWLAEQFEFEFCYLCGGDERDHYVMYGPFGERRAICKLDAYNRTGFPLE